MQSRYLLSPTPRLSPRCFVRDRPRQAQVAIRPLEKCNRHATEFEDSATLERARDRRLAPRGRVVYLCCPAGSSLFTPLHIAMIEQTFAKRKGLAVPELSDLYSIRHRQCSMDELGLVRYASSVSRLISPIIL